MSKPSIAELLIASGHTEFGLPLVLEASAALYGDVGANLDGRDWAAIMAAGNPMAAAQQALKDQWQDPDYLLRNADHLIGQGYSPIAVEFTYRQMAERLDFTYDPSWSAGTQYAWLGALTDQELAARIAAAEVPQLAFEFTATAVNLDVSHAGTLSFSVAGASQSVAAGDVPLTPDTTVREGFVTLTRASGETGTTHEYVVIGTNAAMDRNFNREPQGVDRVIILGAGNDEVSAGGGDDTVYGGAGRDRLAGNEGHDLIRGGGDADFIHGGKGDDLIFGDEGDDVLYGGTEGHDRLTGGLGEDVALIPNDGTWVDTITDFVSGDDRIAVADSRMDPILRPLSAVGTEIVTRFAGVGNSIEIADNDVHYVSVNGQAGALTTGGTAALTLADLTAPTLTNLAAYLDERFTNAVATGAAGAVDALFVINWTGSSDHLSFMYEFVENAVSPEISASELSLLVEIQRTNVELTAGNVISSGHFII